VHGCTWRFWAARGADFVADAGPHERRHASTNNLAGQGDADADSASDSSAVIRHVDAVCPAAQLSANCTVRDAHRRRHMRHRGAERNPQALAHSYPARDNLAVPPARDAVPSRHHVSAAGPVLRNADAFSHAAWDNLAMPVSATVREHDSGVLAADIRLPVAVAAADRVPVYGEWCRSFGLSVAVRRAAPVLNALTGRHAHLRTAACDRYSVSLAESRANVRANRIAAAPARQSDERRDERGAAEWAVGAGLRFLPTGGGELGGPGRHARGYCWAAFGADGSGAKRTAYLRRRALQPRGAYNVQGRLRAAEYRVV
jgi:hypothetical protein